MISAYISRLNYEMEQPRGRSPAAPTPDLRQRFMDWFSTLPEIGRDRAFAMVELEAALNTQGRYLSPILLNLGWRRKRRWTGRGQYSRYWLPPELG